MLVHAGGSGIGTDRDPGREVDRLHGHHDRRERRQGRQARALGADYVINYRTDRFEGVVRKLTAKKGVDVVFEHVGADTWNGSLLSLKRGGRLVTCGATSGPSASINLMQLFQQQYRITGSFGSPISRADPRRWSGSRRGVRPVIDTIYALRGLPSAVSTGWRQRDVFGKIVVRL